MFLSERLLQRSTTIGLTNSVRVFGAYVDEHPGVFPVQVYRDPIDILEEFVIGYNLCIFQAMKESVLHAWDIPSAQVALPVTDYYRAGVIYLRFLALHPLRHYLIDDRITPYSPVFLGEVPPGTRVYAHVVLTALALALDF